MRKVCAILLLVVSALGAVPAWALAVGDPAPALIVNEFDGTPFDLSQQKGKVILIHFWATWCAPCQEEMEVLNKFYNKYHPAGFEVMALNVEVPTESTEDSAAAMMSFVAFPGGMGRKADVNGFVFPNEIPSSILIDPQGVIRVIKIPDDLPMTEKTLASLILPYMTSVKP